MSTPDAPHTPAGPPPPPSSWPTVDVAGPYAPGDAVPGGAFAPAPGRRDGLAMAAFVVGIVSILLCLIPLVNLLSVLGGLVAVVLAIVALRRLAPGVTGKGFAITGLVLGAISAVVAGLVLAGLAVAAQSFDSEEFEQLLEDVEAAERSGVAGDGPQALPTEAPTEAAAEAAPAEAPVPAEVPAEVAADGVVREDFSDVTCDVVREEAIAMAQESPEPGEPGLVDIVDSVPVEDHRTDYAVPAGTDESLLLSCRGMAAWDDASQSPILTEVTIDGAGNLYVGATAE